MAFGPIMQLKVGELDIRLAPIAREEVGAFVSPGMQQASVTHYLSRQYAPVLEDEQDWFDKVRKANTQVVWGIWVKVGDEWKIIGSTSLFDIQRKHIHQAISGSLIFDKSYWGRGIASHIHKARTWYAFKHMGLHRITSAVLHGNPASSKALAKSGYAYVYTERNYKFSNGELRHEDCFECLNPKEDFWKQWWHGDRVPKKSLEARKISREAMEWAEKNVTLL